MNNLARWLLAGAASGLIVSSLMMAQVPSYSVSTVAGTFPADAPGSVTYLTLPRGVAVDTAGNVYIADTFANRIRKLDITAGTVTTIVGDGVSGSTGDGGPAGKARVSGPNGLFVDSAGNLYIADSGNNKIRKVDATTGNISTIAGTGSSGFSGDGRAATLARIRNPQQIYLDSKGNIYIADKENNRIRYVDTKGNIHTLAGQGGDNTTTAGGFAGDAGTVVNGVAITGYARLARLGQPQGVCVDSKGNVYVGDTSNNRIRKVDTNGIITTVAGDGSTNLVNGVPGTLSGLNQPRHCVVDSSDNIYVAEAGGQRIRKIDTNGIITAVAASGLSHGGQNPTAISVAVHSSDGLIYVADTGNNRIRKIFPDGNAATVGSGSSYGGDGGAATGAQFLNLRGVTSDASGNVFITDTGNQRIRKVNSKDGTINTIAGNGTSGFSGDPGPATALYSQVNAPWGGVFDASGVYYFADRGHNRIRTIDTLGNITTIAGTTITFPFNVPGTVNRMRPTKVNANVVGGYFGDGGPATAALLNAPSSVALDNLGNIYIADTNNHAIRKVDAKGIITTVAGVVPDCASQPVALSNPAAPPTANVDVTSACVGISGGAGDGFPAVLKGGTGAVSGGTSIGYLNAPLGVAVDTKGNLYIADTNNHVVRVVGTDGVILPLAGIMTSNGGGSDKVDAGTAQLDTPSGVAVDSNGNVFIADTNNGRIRRIDATTNIIQTIAGTGTDFKDGPDALKTELINPLAISVDSAGNVYFTDLTNRVRKLTPAAAPSK